MNFCCITNFRNTRFEYLQIELSLNFNLKKRLSLSSRSCDTPVGELSVAFELHELNPRKSAEH